MNEKSELRKSNDSTLFSDKVGASVQRRINAEKNVNKGVWFGLGMMGLIGWSVAVPTLLGAALGIWLDKRNLGEHQWTLALIMAGLTIGCLNAWTWVAKEDKAMHEENEDKDD